MKKYLFILCFLTGASVVSSQSLNKEITIKKDIVPEEQNFSPLNTLPTILTFPQPEVRLEYNTLGLPAAVNPIRDTGLFSQAAPSLNVSPWRGYVDAGYFPLYNTSVSAGYRFIDTSADKLAAWAQFTGYSWKSKAAGQEEKFKLNDNNFNLGLAYSHTFNPLSVLDVKARYAGYWYNVPLGGNVSLSDAVNEFDGEIGWNKNTSGHRIAVRGNAKLFSMNKPWIENYDGGAFKNLALKLEGEILFDGDEYVKSRYKGVKIDIEGLHSGYRNRFHDMGTEAPGNVNDVLNIGIAFIASNPSYFVNLGVRPSFVLKGESKKLTVAPNVEASYKLTSAATITAYIKGGDRITSLDDIFDRSHYVNPYSSVNFSRIPLDFGARLSIGPWRGFNAALKGGYNYGKDWLMPFAYFGNFTNELATKGAYIGIEAGYNWNETVEVKASWLMVPGKDKSYYLVSDRANNIVDFKIRVQPIDELIIDATFNGRFGRRFMISENESVETGNVLNLCVGGRYSFTESFGVFIRGENLLNRRWTSIAGAAIDMPGIRGLAGVSFRF